MKNAFSRMGRKCASIMIGGGLITTGLFAAVPASVSVTFPHAVTIGGNVLPGGQYTITALDLAASDEFFVIRSAKTAPVTVQAQKVTTADDAAKTQVVFSKEGDVWHFDKMFIEGDDNSYQFINTK